LIQENGFFVGMIKEVKHQPMIFVKVYLGHEFFMLLVLLAYSLDETK
jgi:hypothetical protein